MIQDQISPVVPAHARLNLLQALRGVAALSVLALHDFIQIKGTGTKISLGNDSFSWGWVGVDVFFCISGFIMAWVHAGDLGKPGRAKSFALKRFFRIYPPYFVALVFVFAVVMVEQWSGHARIRDSVSLWQSLFLLPPYKGLLIGIAWTLTHESFFYVLFCAAIVLGRRIAAAGFVIWLVSIAAYHDAPDGTEISDFIFSPVNLEFLAGLLTAGLVRRFRAPRASWLVLGLSILVLILGFRLDWWHFFNGLHLAPSIPEKGVLALCCCGLIFALVRIEINHQVRVPPFLVFIGTASYSIYLIHLNIMWWMAGAVSSLLPSLLTHPALTQAVLVLIGATGVGSGLAFYTWVERPLLQWSRHWQKSEGGESPA